MNQTLNRKVLSFIMEYIHKNNFDDLDDYVSKLAHNYCRLLLKAPSGITQDEFLKSMKNTKTVFFKTNKVNKRDFIYQLHSRLGELDLKQYIEVSGYEIAKNFISGHIEVGYDKSKFTDERNSILEKLEHIQSPHDILIQAFEILLQRLSESFQVSLHGTKEYSGIDISKKVNDATIGFHLKSVNDDISEDKIRAQTSKALEYKLDGFVWIYGCPSSKKVESSIQAAYHHFNRINETQKMYCALIPPELLAELFRRYEIDL